MSKKIEFETYRDIGSYEINNLTKTEPSVINFLSYKKTKVTVEQIEEPTEVYIERLENLLENTTGFSRRRAIEQELLKLKNTK